jgi:hypothetical protein
MPQHCNVNWDHFRAPGTDRADVGFLIKPNEKIE